MTDWPEVSLSECLRAAGESIPVRADGCYPNFGLFSFGRGLFHKPPILGLKSSATSLTRVRRGQFVYSRLFAFEGAYGIVGDEFDKFYVSNEYPAFEVDASKLLPGFLRLHLSRPSVWTAIAQGSKGVGVRRQRVHPDQVLAHKMRLPPLLQQQRIVDRIDDLARTLDHVASLRAQVASELDALATALAFRADLSDGEREVAGWRKCRLDVVMRASDNFVPVRSDESYANFGIYSFGRGLFKKPAISGLLSSAPSLNCVRAGQFIYSRLFAFEGAYGIVTDEFGGSFVSNEYPTFDCDPDALLPEVLAAYLRPKATWAKIAEGSKGLGDRRQRVQPQQLLAHELWLPPMHDQRILATVWGELQVARRAQVAAANESDALLPAILDRALTGAL